MIVHEHHSGSRGSPARGRELGATWARTVHRAANAYQSHFRALGISDADTAAVADASFQALSEWAPRLSEELRSIADGAGISLRRLSMLNARTEVLAIAPPAGEGECSTAVQLLSGGTPTAAVVGFQTWDWHAELAPAGLMWRYEPRPGRWVKTFTEPGMLAKIGVNSSGLGVHLNILRHRGDSATEGVPVHAVARRILDEADSVDDAWELARSAPVGASTVITVLGPASDTVDAAAVELSPVGVARIGLRPDGWLLHTNHFLDARLSEGDALDPQSTSSARFDHLEQMILTGGAGGANLPALAASLSGPAGPAAPICLTEDERSPATHRWRTLLTVRLEPDAGLVEYWPGSPDQAARVEHALRF